VTVDPANVDAYLDYRREQVNPAMASMPGFRNTITLIERGADGAFLIINHWDNEDAWRNYQKSEIHDRLRNTIRGELVRDMRIARYVTTDLPASEGLDADDAAHTYLTVSTHRVRTDQPDIYLNLRATSVHPSMAEFEGFVSSNALASLDEPYAFLIVNSWESIDGASAYGSSPEHFWLRDQVRALLSEHSGTRQYDVVAL
jgi:quinol monooxygenase YgiN